MQQGAFMTRLWQCFSYFPFSEFMCFSSRRCVSSVDTEICHVYIKGSCGFNEVSKAWKGQGLFPTAPAHMMYANATQFTDVQVLIFVGNV